MSELRPNIRDRHRVIHGNVHDGIADAVLAALSEPETIAELEVALDRFIKPRDDFKPSEFFHAGLNEEPGAAGIVIVDIAAGELD